MNGKISERYFPKESFLWRRKGTRTLLPMPQRGGGTKVFDVPSGKLILNDCGIIGKTTDGTVLTSQWIDSSFIFIPQENGFSVSGALHTVPAHKTFTPV